MKSGFENIAHWHFEDQSKAARTELPVLSPNINWM